MKRRILSALALLLAGVCLLAGCKRNPAGESFAQAVEGMVPEPTEPRKLEGVVLAESPDFSDTLGFAVVALPDDDALRPTGYFALDGWFGQIEYLTADERQYVLRIARASDTRLTTTFAESHDEGGMPWEVDGVTVKLRRSSEECYAATWEKDGFQYLLHSNKLDPKPPDDEINRFVQEVNTGLTDA